MLSERVSASEREQNAPVGGQTCAKGHARGNKQHSDHKLTKQKRTLLHPRNEVQPKTGWGIAGDWYNESAIEDDLVNNDR
eukprot:4167383-Pleurochrysis_carterae.AAC.4